MVEQRSERLDRALGRLREGQESYQNRLTLDNLRLAERYVQAELRIGLLYFAAGVVGEEYLALLQHSAPRRSFEDSRGFGSIHGLIVEEAGDSLLPDSVEVEAGDVKEPVLV